MEAIPLNQALEGTGVILKHPQCPHPTEVSRKMGQPDAMPHVLPSQNHVQSIPVQPQPPLKASEMLTKQMLVCLHLNSALVSEERKAKRAAWGLYANRETTIMFREVVQQLKIPVLYKLRVPNRGHFASF